MSNKLFTSLCAQIDGGHFGNAIKTCEKILRLNPDDADARTAKLFLLLHTEQYDAALAHVRPENTFEHAYALYRLKREHDATALLDAAAAARTAATDATALDATAATVLDATALHNHRGALHLRAQIAYRTAAYADAVALYTHLLESADPTSDEHSDIHTNLHAAQRHLDFTSTGFLAALAAPTAPLESAPPPRALPDHPHPHLNRNPTDHAPPRKSRVVPALSPPPDPVRSLKKSDREPKPKPRM